MVICFTKHLLDQKHNLSKIWLAAHWEKKIKRPQIFEIDIEKTIQDMIEAEIILDLRISGHLLVGIVRIHSKKTKYLLSECNTIFCKVKIFHAGRIDLPYNNLTAFVNDITLADCINDNPENVDKEMRKICNKSERFVRQAGNGSIVVYQTLSAKDFEISPSRGNYFLENLWWKPEEYARHVRLETNIFSHMWSDEAEILDIPASKPSVDALFSCNQSRLEDITLKETAGEQLTLLDDDMMNFEFHEEDEPFEFPGENLLSAYNALEATRDPTAEPPKDVAAEQSKDATVSQSNKILIYNKVTLISLKEANTCLEAREDESLDEFQPNFENIDEYVLKAFDTEHQINEIPESFDLSRLMDGEVDREFTGNHDISTACDSRRNLDVLELEPLNVSGRMYMRAKNRKRKLCIDYVKRLSDEDLKRQVLDTSDIMSAADRAPYSKRLMTLKEIGSAEKLFCLPFLKLQNKRLLKIYQRNLKTRPCEDFDSTSEEDDIAPKPQTRRKRSRCESSERPDINGNMLPDLVDSPAIPVENVTNLSVDNDFPDPVDNFPDNEATDGLFEDQAPDDGLENQAYDILLAENLPSSQLQISSLTDLQSTPISKTSQEKWEYVLQGRIIQTLNNLKQLFDGGQSKVAFSSIAKNNRRLWVAQKFLCLLMLQKFEVISLDQRNPYGEIFINRGLHFETACTKFCSI